MIKRGTITKNRLIFIVIVGVFLGLSIFAAYRFSPWHDESYSAILIERSVPSIVAATANDVHPPLYYVALKAWASVVGYSMPVLRIMSALFMLGAIVIIWRTMIREQFITHKRFIVLVAMLFGAFTLRFSFEARMYGMGAFLIALAFWLQMSIMKLNKISWRHGVGLGLVFAAAVYTHYFLLFFIAATLIYTVWAVGPKKVFSKVFYGAQQSAPVKTMAVSYATAALIFLPWLPTAFNQYKEVTGGGFWIGPMTVNTVPSMLLNSLVYVRDWMVHGWPAVAALVLIIAGFASLAIGYKHITANAAGKYAFSVVVIPLIILIFVSLPPFTPAFQDRYLSFYGAFLYAMIAVSMVYAWQHKKGWFVRCCAVVLALGVVVGAYNVLSMGNNQGYTPYPYFVSNAITNDVLAASKQGRAIVVVSNDLWYFFDVHVDLKDTGIPTYMYLKSGQDVYPYGNWSAINGRNELMLRESGALPKDTEVWLVHSSGDSDSKDNPFATLPQLGEQKYGYAKVTIYQN